MLVTLCGLAWLPEEAGVSGVRPRLCHTPISPNPSHQMFCAAVTVETRNILRLIKRGKRKTDFFRECALSRTAHMCTLIFLQTARESSALMYTCCEFLKRVLLPFMKSTATVRSLDGRKLMEESFTFPNTNTYLWCLLLWGNLNKLLHIPKTKRRNWVPQLYRVTCLR